MNSPYTKSIFAVLSALVAALLIVIDNGITAREALEVVAATLAIGSAVFLAPRNTPTLSNLNKPGNAG